MARANASQARRAIRAPQSQIEVRPPRGTAEVERLLDVVFQSFAGFARPREWTRRWFNELGPKNWRVALADGKVQAGLGILWFGQYFGGREVSAGGISAVGVAPEARGTGLATEMMRAVVRQQRERGYVLSVLFPSTYALYRKAGYEPAGARIFYKLDPAALGVRDHSRAIVPLTAKDIPAMRRCYERYARWINGQIARTPADWKRVLTYSADPIYAYGVPAAGKRGELDGYIVYTQSAARFEPYTIEVRDVAAGEIGAIRRLLTLLGEHSTMASKLQLEGGPAMALLTMAREEYVDVKHRVLWMIRVLDVEKALTQRGYSAAVRGTLHFEIDDALIAENSGRWTLTVDAGRAKLMRGGEARIRTTIRGLAPLFSGHLSAHELLATGLLDGDEDQLHAATALFAGPTPWMSDRF